MTKSGEVNEPSAMYSCRLCVDVNKIFCTAMYTGYNPSVLFFLYVLYLTTC